MNLFKKCVGTAALALGLSAGPSHAIVIDGVGDTFTVLWSQTGGDIGTNVLSASATVTVTAFSASQILFDIDISNTSVLTTFANAGLASFGFGTNPPATSVSLSNAVGAFQGADLDTIPSQNFVNLCVWAGNSCNGGGQNGLLAVGASDFDIQLTVNGAGGIFANGFDIFASAVKFQTSGGSFEFPGIIIPCVPGTPGCTPPPGGDVPEPTTLLLLGAGVLGAGLARRRLKRAG